MKNKEEVLLKLSNNQQKFQLALMDDVKASIAEAKKFKDNLKNTKNKAVNALIAYKDNAQATAFNANQAIKSIDELDKKSKELGLGDAGLSGWKKELQQVYKDSSSLFNSINSVLSNL